MGVFLVQGEWRRFGAVKQLHFLYKHLDPACVEVGVDGVVRSEADYAPCGNDPFGTKLVGFPVGLLRVLRIEDQLDQPPSVTQIDEDNAAMVSASEYPAHNEHLAVHIFFTYFGG